MNKLNTHCPTCGKYLDNKNKKDEDKRNYCDVRCVLMRYPELHPNHPNFKEE